MKHQRNLQPPPPNYQYFNGEHMAADQDPFETLANSSNNSQNSSSFTSSSGILLGVLGVLGFLAPLFLLACWERRRAYVLGRRAKAGLKKRRKEVEEGLIIMHAQNHDSSYCSERVVVNESTISVGEATTTKSTDDAQKRLDLTPASTNDEESDAVGIECPICFEEFQVGVVVVCSPGPSCHHVFHQKCLVHWLEKNIECPCCREVVLLRDCASRERDDTDKPTDEEKRMFELAARTAADFQFCCSHGLVQPSSCSWLEVADQQQEGCCNV